MSKCYFNNNTAFSTVGNSYGGTISINYGDFTALTNFFSNFDNCEFFLTNQQIQIINLLELLFLLLLK